MRRTTARWAIATASLGLFGTMLAAGNTPSTAQVTEYQFVDVTAAAGVANATQAHWGATWSDYDSDGFIDLYVVNGANPPGGVDDENALYRNNGDGTFTDVTAATGTGDPWIAMRNIWADYDRDGDLDLYSHNFEQSTLYQNNGNVFTDVNATSGAGIQMAKATGAAFGDYDNDGYVDIHATGFPGVNVLLHNNGDGTFTNVQDSSGMSLAASGMGNVWGDYDLDGDIDLAITAVTSTDPTFLYQNNGDGTFTDVTTDAGIVVEFGSSNAAVNWADYDNDGDWDLHITEVNAGSIKTLPTRMYLFQNQGDGTFVDATAAAGMTPTTMTDFWDAAFADWDSDGDIDMYLAGNGPDIFYENNGDGTFTDVASDVGLQINDTTWGVVWGDYENDGDMDLYVVRKQGPSANVLYENQGGSNNWLQLELRGTVSNLDAIGARITVMANGELMMREITGGSGFFSQNSFIQHFGLGQSTTIDSVEIVWPSGIVQTVDGLTINERYLVVEAGGGAPIANFTATPTLLDVEFDASASFDDGTIVSYDWDFGDGSVGTSVMTTHAYAAPGTYTVSLTVTDDNGGTDTASQDVTATDASAAIHVGDLDGVSADDDRGWNAVATVRLHDSGEAPVAGATVDATWSDGAATSASCVTDTTGMCSVTSSRLRDSTPSATLTVDTVTLGGVTYDDAANHDPDGDSDGTVIVVEQAPVGNVPPVASFTWSCTNLDCTFTDTSTDGDGSVVGWAWDFGDSGSDTIQNPAHSYTAPGSYTVELTVTDNEGGTDTTSTLVTATEPGGGSAMHVADLDGVGLQVGRTWKATVTVSVIDDQGAGVSGTLVEGVWLGGSTDSCTTAGDGTCSVVLTGLGRDINTSFTVTNVTLVSMTYDPGSNTDPDGDSDGTVIVVVRPQ